ncbi:hypothetical protein ABKN59_006061 [Abortiporus biennis]
MIDCLDPKDGEAVGTWDDDIKATATSGTSAFSLYTAIIRIRKSLVYVRNNTSHLYRVTVTRPVPPCTRTNCAGFNHIIAGVLFYCHPGLPNTLPLLSISHFDGSIAG